MKKYIAAIFVTSIVFYFTACNQNKKKEISTPKTETTESVPFEPAISYTQFIKKAKEASHILKSNLIIDSLQTHVFKTIAYEMPSYWIGTKWDFNGVSRVLREGTIACGYFVTTVLEDIGFKLNRIKLSQQASSVMITSLCANVKRFSTLSDLKKHLLTSQKNNIFIVGLDFHTGFILKENEQLYFFHSNYIGRQGVIKELVDDSRALQSSKSFMTGSITDKLPKGL